MASTNVLNAYFPQFFIAIAGKGFTAPNQLEMGSETSLLNIK